MRNHWLRIGIVILLVCMAGGYIGTTFFQISLSNRIYVGQMGMENPNLVVGRDEKFPRTDSPSIDVQILLSIRHRMLHDWDGLQHRIVVTDLQNNNIPLDRVITPTGYSTVMNLHPIQQQEGRYEIIWYVDRQIIARKVITIQP